MMALDGEKAEWGPGTTERRKKTRDRQWERHLERHLQNKCNLKNGTR